MSHYELWCLVEGENVPFPVIAPSSISIGAFKVLIKAQRSNDLHSVDAVNLTLAKVDLSLDTIGGDLTLPNTDPLATWRKLSNVWPELPPDDHLHVLVRLPPSVVIGSPTLVHAAVGQQPMVVDSGLVKEYADTFIKVKMWGAFHTSDIDENKIYECRAVPDFVTELEQELDRKPGMNPHLGDMRNHMNAQFRDAYFEASQEQEEFSSESESHQGRRRDAPKSEMFHLQSIASVGWERLWNGNFGSTLKEPSMIAMLFYYFALQACGTITAQLSHQSWPFQLITKCETMRVKERLRKYEPRSDFLILKSSLPRLLIQVNSKPRTEWPEDLIRMFVTGAAVVRFANAFLDAFKKEKNFVLFAMYIWDNGEITRYSLFQESQGLGVHYNETKYSLNNLVGRAKIVRELYNLSHMLEREEKAKDTKVKITELKVKINQHDLRYPMKSFFTRENQEANNNNRAKKRRLDKDIDDGACAGAAGGVNAADRAELRAHGYEVKPEAEDIVDPGGKYVLQVFKIQMPSHMLTVYQPSDPSKEFIAKKVREDSNELQILKFLNSFQPPHEHIISLHDSFQTELTSWAILPQMDSVADYVMSSPDELHQNVPQVCWGLIKGVAFLHQLCVAHRDIKPHNLLLDRDFCLKIIDFDIAQQVTDENEEVEHLCGTKGWMAPEIEERLMYSPIKADRWSSGRVLLYVLEKSRKVQEPLITISQKLTARNPKLRPSMLEIAAPLVDADNVVDERKAS